MTCPHAKAELRPELDPLPERIAKLPVDRGYPVPWFVAWIDGKPEFRAMDEQKWVRAVKERRCWICGEPLGRYLAFPIGPMCGLNRTTSEPPSHLDCAKWSVRNCPFLSQKENKYREDDFTREMDKNVAGFGIKRQPGAVLIWITKDYRVFRDHVGKPLIQIGAPVDLSWWSHGRPATRAEVAHSVDTGMPYLMELAEMQGPEAVQELLAAKVRFEPLYPRE